MHKSQSIGLLALLFLLPLFVFPLTSYAAWIHQGVPVCTANGDQQTARIASDGGGGVFMCWTDNRAGNFDIYAQRIDSSGNILWTTDGEAVCTETGSQNYAQMIADGVGNTIITWVDYRSGNNDIYAQRLDASGTAMWTINGLSICSDASAQSYPEIVPDGSGGAIITWYDNRNGIPQIYAQHVNSAGTMLWDADGMQICTISFQQYAPKLVSDGSGGAVITWQDNRSGTFDIYAQRVDTSGNLLWDPDGVTVSSAGGDQITPIIDTDESGGAIITWQDGRSGTWDIYAQRLNSSGVPLWTTGGVAVCTASETQYTQRLVPDGSHGAIIAWQDRRVGSEYDIYAQRIDASGNVQWTVDGIPICTYSGNQAGVRLVSDDAGGAHITWSDNSRYNVYCQRVDAAGNLKWPIDGAMICYASYSQSYVEIASDGNGEAILVWRDGRDFYNGDQGNDIYAQHTPVCEVVPSILDFGTVPVGQNSDLTVTLRNAGGGNLPYEFGQDCSFTNFELPGGYITSYLTAGASRTVTVRFHPSTAGPHTCTLLTGTNCDVPLSGVGEDPPACQVSTTSLDFGTVPAGSSADLGFTITNTGGGTLSGSVSETCDHYSIISGGGAYNLTSGQFVTVSVRFTPPACGTYPCTIATGTECNDVACTGIGGDESPPVLSGCPNNASYQCVSDVPAPAHVTAVDDCEGAITPVFTEVDDGGTCPRVITRTWTATDNSGNSAACTQILTIDDTTPPVLSGCPSDIAVECLADVPAPANVTATDNCDGTITPVLTEIDEGGTCPRIITRTWTATDECGNQDVCSQIVTIDDTTPPTISGPAPLVVQCMAEVPAPDVNVITASDNCGSVTVTHDGDELTGTCPKSLNRSYRAVDLCGNTAAYVQVITIDDRSDPVFVECPEDASFECYADVPPPADVEVIDNCGAVMTLTFQESESTPGSSCDNTITRTWTAEDSCGNTASCTQIITVNDNTPPILAGCPEDSFYACAESLPPPANVTVSDNCDSLVTLSFEQTETNPGAICGNTLTRTWTATDICGNSASCSHTIIIDDPPLCQVVPDSLDFGVIAPDDTRDTTFTITNIGGGILSGVVSEACGSYEIISGGGVFNLANGQSVVVSVRFAPTEHGAHTCIIETGTGGADVPCSGFCDETIDVMVHNYMSAWRDNYIEITWEVKEISGNLAFAISRRSSAGGTETEIRDAEITRKQNQFVLVDRTAQPGETYTYRVTILEDDVVMTSFETDVSVPSYAFALFNSHPNPFKQSMRIEYSLNAEEGISLDIYDISGRHVRTILHGRRSPGLHAEEWDGRDDQGQTVSSGIYFYRLKAGKKSLTKKAILLK